MLALCTYPESEIVSDDELPFAFEAEYALGAVDPGLAFSRMLTRLHLFDNSQNLPFPDTLTMMLPQTPTGFGPVLRRAVRFRTLAGIGFEIEE